MRGQPTRAVPIALSIVATVKQRLPPSLMTVLVLWSGLAAASFLNRPSFLFGWDSFGYHLYLPALFIHSDPLVQDISWVEAVQKTYDASGTLYQISTLPDGTRLPKYTMGLAVLWSPWFLAGHALAKMTGHPADGYSAPYQLAVQAGMLLYLLCGLLALRKVLRSFFAEGITSITLCLLFLATNLLDQVIAGAAMPHLPLFCLYAFILLFTVEWSRDRRPGKAIALAVAMGMAMLVRPSEAACLLIPLLWSAEDESVNPLDRLWRYRAQWGMIAVILLLVGLPQFLYWHAATGHWSVDTYNNAGEGFDLLGPHTRRFLFSFRKGWYVYTPLMLIATGGILLLRQRMRPAFVPILCFFLVNLYLLSSWTCWWYADSFGSRAMTGSYAVMALPIAAVIDRIRILRWPYRHIALATLFGIAVLNLFQYWQFRNGLIHSSRMTRAAYFAAFGRTAPAPGFEDLLLVQRSYSGTQGSPDGSRYSRKYLPAEITIPAASGSDTLIADTSGGGERRAFRLRGADTFSPAIRIPFHLLTLRDHAWVEAEWRVKTASVPFKGSLIHTMEHDGKSYAYDGRDLDRFDLVPGQWATIRTWYLTPEPRSVEDPFVAYFWSRDTMPILVEGPYITVHEPLGGP